jgi:hypothetical protein
MTPALRSGIVTLLTKALGALSPSSPPVATALTAAHLGALPRFLTLIPISDLVALATGAGSVDDVLSVAEAGASIVARAFPPAAITAEEVKLGLEALQFLIDAADLGSSPFEITPGYRPPLGGFAGARGHI